MGCQMILIGYFQCSLNEKYALWASRNISGLYTGGHDKKGREPLPRAILLAIRKLNSEPNLTSYPKKNCIECTL